MTCCSYDRQLGTVAWPTELDAALKTRGFTEQVRTFMGTARSLGLAPDQIASLNPERPDWAALSTFMTEYLDVIDSQGLLDYSELVSRAVAYAESPDGQRRLRDRYQLVVVDEYQDTDPAQERLLRAIAGDGRDLVAVGDPDQSIYAFRGADVRGITEFVDRFRNRVERASRDPHAAHITALRRRDHRARRATSLRSWGQRAASRLPT